MKKIFYYTFAFLLMTSSFSCDENDNIEDEIQEILDNNNQNNNQTNNNNQQNNNNQTNNNNQNNNNQNNNNDTPAKPTETKSDVHVGRMTFYDLGGLPATGITEVPSGMMSCAMHEDNLNEEGLEGACIEITYNGKSALALVRDCLPNTDELGDGSGKVKKNHIDLQKGTEKLLGITNPDGILNIEWKVVKLPTTEPIHYQMKDGNNAWHIGIRPMYQAYPIKKIEINVDGKYYQMSRTTAGRCYNLYEMQVPNPKEYSTPLKLRVTSIYGDVLEDEVSSFNEGDRKGKKNF